MPSLYWFYEQTKPEQSRGKMTDMNGKKKTTETKKKKKKILLLKNEEAMSTKTTFKRVIARPLKQEDQDSTRPITVTLGLLISSEALTGQALQSHLPQTQL